MTASASPFSLASVGFWRCYWVTLRPYLFFVSAVSGLVGLALAEQLGWAALIAAFVAFFVSYGLGQAVTDAFQKDTDAISSPYRPLTQGLITTRQVLLVSLLGLGLCALVFVMLNPLTLLLSALAVVGLLTYTPLKRRWWAGPLWNAWIVALLPALGLLCAAPAGVDVFGSATLRAAMASVFFSYAVFVLLGYFKDISADRATGYHTLPVEFGWGFSVLVSAGLGVAALLASARLVSMSGVIDRAVTTATMTACGLWLAGALALAGAHALMLGTRRERQAHLSISWVVRSYLFLHLGEAVAFKPLLAWPALGFYALFEITLAQRPERSQV